MIPQGTEPKDEYIGNDTSAVYAITFPTYEDEDLIVEVEDSDGNITTLVQDTDYTLDDIGIPNQDGEITLIDASQDWISGTGNLDTGFILRVKFTSEAFQPTVFRDLGKFAPEFFGKALDRLTMCILAIRDMVVNFADQIAEIISDVADLDDRVTDLENASEEPIEYETVDFTAEYGKVHVVNGASNVTLPAPIAGKTIKLKAFTVPFTVLRNGGEKIDDVAANVVIDSEESYYQFKTDGTDWIIT